MKKKSLVGWMIYDEFLSPIWGRAFKPNKLYHPTISRGKTNKDEVKVRITIEELPNKETKR